jgi:CRISPR-associated protein Csm1
MLLDQAVDEFKFITRAALVHDLGKVCLRSAPERTEHSFLGARYLETYLTDSGTKEKFLNCVKYHHAHNLKTASLAPNDLSYIVYEADNIAAGTDRRLNESGERGFEAMSCLESVFNLMGETSQVKNNFLLRDLNVHEPVNYPVPEKHLATAGQYQKILNTISDNFKLAGPDTMEPNELLKLLEATLSYVPSSTAVGEVCDISLYDHQKITAALAVCMLHYFKGTGVSDYQAFCYGGKNADFRNQPAFLLVSGDISGIQDFIYTVPSNGALKTLRGRSFYLEVLLENIVDEILGSLGAQPL